MAEARAVGDERSSAGAGNALNVPAGYKRTEAGVIPDDWGVSTVAAEFNVQLGKMLDAAKNTGASKPYIGNRSVQWGRIDLADIDTVPMTSADLRRFRLRSGDLLVCEGGEIGRAAIWEEPIRECYFQKALHRLRPIRSYDSYLMMSFLQLWASTGYLTNYVTQTSIAHLPKDKLETVPLPVPTAAEQRAIAAVLSDVDELIGSLEALIAKKRAIKQAAMQELLAGRTRLPGFGGEWETKRISELAKVDPENLTGSTDQGFRFNYISLDNVVAGRLVGYSRESYGTAPTRARRVLRMRDILMSTVRPTLNGHLYFHGQVTNAVCSTGFAVLRARCDLCDPHFLFAHLFGEVVSAQLQKLLVGSNYPAINSGQVARLKVPCPRTFEEQQAIATTLSDMDAEIAALERRLDKTRAIKQGMMQQLLTGSIRLPIPDDDTEDDDAHDA